MTATVRIPAPLRSFTGGADELSVEGRTIGEVLEHLTNSCDGLGERVLDGKGRLRHFVNVYLGSHDIRTLQGLETPVEDGAVVSIVPAVAGGRGRSLSR
jgi:molybdopterin converting factor small subunit